MDDGGGPQWSKLNTTYQAAFFDDQPPLYPWPNLLRSSGLSRVCKPREAMWKYALEGLGMVQGDRVLDVGCGTGVWLDRLKKHFGIRGIGVDISKSSLKTAVSKSSPELGFLCGDGPHLPFTEGYFDVVVSLDVLEHVEDQKGCLREMTRVLKPGGSFFLWTLNRAQRYTWNWWLDKIGIDIYDRVAHDPMLLPDVSKVRDLLDNSGMVVNRLVPFNSFFTLAMDEAIMLIVSAFDKLGLFETEGWLSRNLGKGFLATVDLFSRSALPFLSWLDRPWTRRGYSNGVLVIARRNADRAVGLRNCDSFEEQFGAGIPAGSISNNFSLRLTRCEDEWADSKLQGVATWMKK